MDPSSRAQQPGRITAYTSFDGDLIANVSRMCFATLLLDVVPLNPEAALGYYISTTALGNRKESVMQACLAVQFKADEFWIITDSGDDALSRLPEGVLAEYLLWRELRPESPVRHFRWLGEDWRTYLLSDSRPKKDVLEDATVSDEGHGEILQSMTPSQRCDLDEKLLRRVRVGGLMPTAFLSTSELDDKHLDWARASAFGEGVVPLSPSTLFPSMVQDMLDFDASERRALRDSLLARADGMWVIVKPGELSAHSFPDVVSDDIRAWKAFQPDIPIRYLSWADLRVPKYDAPSDWSLTEKERRETREGL